MLAMIYVCRVYTYNPYPLHIPLSDSKFVGAIDNKGLACGAA